MIFHPTVLTYILFLYNDIITKFNIPIINMTLWNTVTFLSHGVSIIKLISPYSILTHNNAGRSTCGHTQMEHGLASKELPHRWS